MPDPVSPTYTAYSAPSPFSSGSSASYPARSPVSEPFDSITDLDHHHTATMDDYTLGYSSPTSLPGYTDLSFVQSQEFDMNMMNWSAPETSSTTAKRHQPPVSSFQHHQQLQQSMYRTVQSQELPNEVERLKNLALYIPPTSPAFHQQRQQSPTIIHSPIPIPVPSNASPHSPSLPSHSPHPLQQSHRAQHHLHDPYYQVDVDKWRTSPTTSHQAQYPPAYTHHTQSHSHSGTMTQGYSSLHGDLSQSSSMRRAASEYSPHQSSSGHRIKQEDMEVYSSLGPYGGHHGHRQRHIFDLSASPPRISVPSHSRLSHISQGPVAFYSHTPQPEQLQQQQHHQQPSFVVHPADLAHREPSVTHPGFEASPVDIGYGADAGYEQTVFGSDSGYADACDPQFVSGVVEKTEPTDSGRDSEVEDEWAARDGGFETQYVGEAADAPRERDDRDMTIHVRAAADADADADGEDDNETGFSPASYAAPPPHQLHQHTDNAIQRGDGPSQREEPRHWIEAEPVEDDLEDEDEEDLESEDDDDMRDPEFVLRRTRRNTSSLSSSYPLEGRNLRSGRFNPYPSYCASPTGSHSGDFAVGQTQEQYSSSPSSSQPLRARRTYPHTHAHTSVSPSTSEPYSPVSVTSTGAPRRRARPTTSLPIPIPVPNLTKKSRGRRVPTMEDFKDDLDIPAPAAPKGKKKGTGVAAKNMRTYTCDVDGCGKLFARGEHLKRHIRSIHTYEKPHRCPYPGCGKDFSRHDNLGQHMRVHKDYVPPKDGQKA
ncbi:hypothetical protein C0995_006074 [Termitomyces sp. Mi166|nr:hypothetical protein C0995_006074 [Termitomyces sp. Mi166\